jgi:hypothetical protein
MAEIKSPGLKGALLFQPDSIHNSAGGMGKIDDALVLGRQIGVNFLTNDSIGPTWTNRRQELREIPRAAIAFIFSEYQWWQP